MIEIDFNHMLSFMLWKFLWHTTIKPKTFFEIQCILNNIFCKVFQSSEGSFWNIKKEILASSTAQYYNNKLRPVWIWFVITIYCIWREPYQDFELDGFSTVSEWNCISQWFNFFLPEIKIAMGLKLKLITYTSTV